MKLKFIYTLFLATFLALVLVNNASGPANVQGLDRTGSPLSPGTCATAGCHTGGAFSPSLTVELLENGLTVSEYEPGKTYDLKATITAGSGTPSAYGIQIVALAGAADANAGSFSVGNDMQVIPVNGRDYAEHNSPGDDNIFELDWTAPSSGTGPVRFYAAANAANGNGQNTGDGVASLGEPLTITELVTSTSSIELASVKMSVFPNPVPDHLDLTFHSIIAGEYELSLVDLTGKTLYNRPVHLTNGEQSEAVNVSWLSPGMYLVQLSKGGARKMLKVIKQ